MSPFQRQALCSMLLAISERKDTQAVGNAAAEEIERLAAYAVDATKVIRDAIHYLDHPESWPPERVAALKMMREFLASNPIPAATNQGTACAEQMDRYWAARIAGQNGHRDAEAMGFDRETAEDIMESGDRAMREVTHEIRDEKPRFGNIEGLLRAASMVRSLPHLVDDPRLKSYGPQFATMLLRDMTDTTEHRDTVVLPPDQGHYHEALHTAYVLLDTYESHVAGSHAVSSSPTLKAIADKVTEAMAELYQAIGVEMYEKFEK